MSPIYRQSLITVINGASIGTVAHDCRSPIEDWRVESCFGNRRERRFSTASVGFAFKGINAWVQWGIDAWTTALGSNGWPDFPIDSEDLTFKDLLESFKSGRIKRRWESRVPSENNTASLASARSASFLVRQIRVIQSRVFLRIDAASHQKGLSST